MIPSVENKKAAQLACAVMGIAVLLTLVCGGLEWRIPSGVFKRLASFSFLAVAIFSGALQTRFGMIIFTGFRGGMGRIGRMGPMG